MRAFDRSLLALFGLSGCAALGYQLVWTRQFATGLGHELPAAYAVVAAFFGGFAVGGLAFDRAISTSPRPGAWYVGLEFTIAAWALVTLLLGPPANELARTLIGVAPAPARYWVWAFSVPFFALLPATVAMGATLVAAERWFAARRGDPRQLGRVYGWNTAGAAAGVLLTTGLLMPRLGLDGTLALLCAMNVFVAVAALALGAGVRQDTAPTTAVTTGADAVRGTRGTTTGARLLLAGLLGIGYEVASLRVMAQVFEGTVYSFAAVLAVYLCGTAGGAALYQRYARGRDAAHLLALASVALALSCALGSAALFGATTLYRVLRSGFGDTPLGVLAAEITLALPVFLLPTLVMGALFSHLALGARRHDGGIGWALAMNTVGALVAPLVFGVWLYPLLGAKWTLASIALGYLALLPRASPLPRWLPALPLVAVACLPDALRIVTLRPGETLLDYREGRLASVAVTARPGARDLRVNNRYQMGGTDIRALRIQRMQAHLPLLMHPRPERVLLLGVASGVTAGAALAHPHLALDAVELVPETLELLDHFVPDNRAPHASSRARLSSGDARRYVRTSTTQYDVVIGDLFHPARDGAGLLYTQEHFAAVRERLRTHGVFCQWLPLYQLDLDMLRTIVRSFQSVFPASEAWLANYDLEYPALALLGAEQPLTFASDAFATRLSDAPEVAADLARNAIRNAVQFAGHRLAGDTALRHFAGTGPLNADAFPIVLFAAPRFTYARGQPPHRTLQAFLERAGGQHALTQDWPSDPDVSRYRAARDRYLAVQMRAGTAPAQAAGFIAAAALSGDFTLAYAHVLALAREHATAQPAAVRGWLEALHDARPEVAAASTLLHELGLTRHPAAARMP